MYRVNAVDAQEAAVKSFALSPVLTIQVGSSAAAPASIYAIDIDGAATALPTDVDAAGFVSATIVAPGLYVAGIPAGAATPQPILVSGAVLLPDGVTGLPNAAVYVTDAGRRSVRAITDASGAFSARVTAGAWTVSVDPRANYAAPTAQTINVAAATSLVLQVAAPATSGAGVPPVGAVEVASLRTESSRTFLAGAGVMETIAYAAPVNYRGPDGSWQPVDPTLVPSTSSGYTLDSTTGAFRASFGTAAGTSAPLVRVELADGESFTYSADAAAAPSARGQAGNDVSYTAAASAAEYQYSVGATGIKETIALSAPTGADSYSFTLTPLAGAHFVAAEQADGSWAFTAASGGAPAFVLARPTVTDAGAAAAAGTVALSVAQNTDGSFHIALTLDPRWLHDPARAFPVLIDPTVTIQPNTVDAVYTQGCACAGNFSQTAMWVGWNGQTSLGYESAIKFDLGSIPAATVNSATFTADWYYCFPDSGDPGHGGVGCPWNTGYGYNGTVGVYQINTAWTTATTSTTLEANTSTTAMSTVSISPAWNTEEPPVSKTWTITPSLVQGWLNGSIANNGLLLKLASGGVGYDFYGSRALQGTNAPSLTFTWTSDGVGLYQPALVHSNGASLAWAQVASPLPSGATFQRYEIYRSLTPTFAPSAATWVATITDPAVTQYTDTTAAPNTSFTYEIVTVTNSATSPNNGSNTVTVTTPADGYAQAIYQPIASAGQMTYINSGQSGSNFSTSPYLYVGGAGIYRTLIRFDLRQIPTTATVSAATLSLYSVGLSGTAATIEAHQITNDWTETGASWTQRISGINWATAGGDFSSATAASLPGTSIPNNNHWDSFDITSLAQGWINGTTINYGVLLKQATETSTSETWYSDDLQSGTTTAPLLEPKLAITYADGSHALPPSVAMGSPGAGSTIAGTVQLSAQAGDDGAVTKVEFSIDGGAPIATVTSAPYAATLNSTTLSRGTHTIAARAYDNAGNTATSTINVTVANSAAPTASTPTVTNVGSGIVSIATSATDDLGVSKVEFYANGILIGTSVLPGMPGAPTLVWSGDTATSVQTPAGTGTAFTLGATDITDALRQAAASGDGFAYPDSSVGIWLAMTNWTRNGGAETDTSYWGGAHLSQDTTTAKFGTSSFKVGAATTAGDYSSAMVTGEIIPAASGQTWALSFWRKSGTGTVEAYIRFEDVNGTQVAQQAVSYRLSSGGWDYYTATLNAPANTNQVKMYAWNQSATSAMNIDGVELERNVVATPYIETNGTTVPRAAGRAQETASSLSPTQGWVAARVRMGWSSSNPAGEVSNTIFSWTNGSLNDRLQLLFKTGTNTWELRRQTGGVGASASFAASFAAADIVTLVFAWTATTIGLSVNGNPFATVANTSIPTGLRSTFEVGSDQDAEGTGHELNGDVLWFAAGTGTLTNTDAATFYNVGNTDPSPTTYTIRWNTAAALPGTPTAVWTADTPSSVEAASGNSIVLNVTGNEINDAIRQASRWGDGRAAPDSSFGIWEGTTNLLTNGGFETSSSGWIGRGAFSFAASDSGHALFGSRGFKMITNGTGNFEGVQSSRQSVTASTTYTFSVWVWAGVAGQTWRAEIQEWTATSGGSNVATDTTNFVTAGSAWQRVTVTATTTSTTQAVLVSVHDLNNVAAQTFWIDGAQFEQKPTATPFVNTTSATATRAPAGVQAPASLISASEGWVATRLRMGWSSTQAPSADGYNDTFAWQLGDSNFLFGFFYGPTQRLYTWRLSGGVGDSISVPVSFNSGDTLTIIHAWTPTDVGISVNGGAFDWLSNYAPYQTAVPDLSSVSTINIGSWDGTSEFVDSDVLWFATGKGTLSNADAAAINAVGNGDFAARGVYDGSYSITAKTYDGDGQAAASAAAFYTVSNTSGTKYKATFSTSAIPGEVTYDPTANPQTSWPVSVTVTNTSGVALLATQTVLRYLWISADDAPAITASADIALGSDIAAGASSAPITVNVLPPTLPSGVYRGRYTLRLDLYDSSAGTYFAAKGNKPFEQTTTVNLATPLELGLERFQQYDGADLGGGLTNEVNLANGNNLVSWTPFSEPGIGLDSVLQLTYNSLENGSLSPAGNNVSIVLSGLTPWGTRLDVHPNAADTTAGRTSPWIGFIDGDGSYHTFTAPVGAAYWTAPPGVHLYLRQYSTTDATHWWALTKPDGATFFYDQSGYPTAVTDQNGNTLSFTETAVAAGDDAYGVAEHITQVTDAGNRSFTVSYYTAATTPIAALRGKIQTITDHLAHALSFSYYNDGNLLRLTQVGGTNSDGSWQPSRAITFTYTTPDGTAAAISTAAARANPDATIAQSTKLYSVTDFLGHETTFAYLATAGGTQSRILSRTDRAGSTTSYAYSGSTTTVTMPLSRVWSYTFDARGRVIMIVDPVDGSAAPTSISWSNDNTVARVTEPTGRHVDYAYNQNGYLTDNWNEAGDHLALVYQNVAVDTNDVTGKWESGRTIPHLSRLVAETQPAGNLITNAGFETDTSGWTDAGTASTTLTRDTTTPGFGAAALKATGIDASHYPLIRTMPTALAPLRSGASYTFTVWVNAPTGQSMNIAAYRSDRTTQLGQTTFTGTGAWQLVRLTFTAVANEQDYLYVRSTAALNGGAFSVDAANLTAATSATAVLPTGAATVIDTFATALAAGWSQLAGTTAIPITSAGDLVANGGGSGAYRNDATYGPDVEVGATIAQVGASGDFKLFARLADPTGARNGYSLHLTNASGSINWTIEREDSTGGVLATVNAHAVAAGDLIVFRIVGNTLTGWQITGAGATATQVISATSTVWPGTGRVGTFVDRGGWQIDDFRASTLSTGSGSAFPYTTQFDYDSAGDPVHVTDALGNVTTLTYNANGTVVTQTLPNNGDGITRATAFNNYDANGLPTQVTDAAGGVTRATYDAAGALLTLQDPNHAGSTGAASSYQSQYVYDVFGRLIRSSTPKSTVFALGQLIWSDTSYNANDDVVSQLSPHYGKGDSNAAPAMTTTYDAMDRSTAVTDPDTSSANGGNKTTHTDYDAAGRAIRVTQPLGSQTAIANDYTTATFYDLVDRVSATTQYAVDGTGNVIVAQSRTTNYCYDQAGDLRSVTAAEGTSTFTACPPTSPPAAYTYVNAADTSTYAYDVAHRRMMSTDPLGHATTLTYNANGAVVTTTAPNADATMPDPCATTPALCTTTTTYGARGERVMVVAPFDASATPARYTTTIWRYDALGNLLQEVSPRAFDAATDPTKATTPLQAIYTNYVTTHSYDALGHEVTTSLPTNASTAAAYLQRAYDHNGNVLWSSLPTTASTPGSVGDSDKTINQYWDTGAVYSTAAPSAPKARFDYTGQGWQAARLPETGVGSGTADYTKAAFWAYFADGRIQSQVDAMGLRDVFTYDADGNKTSATEVLGVGAAASATATTVSATFDALDELSKVRVPKDQSANYWSTTFTYDQHGNATQLTQNQEETSSGTVVASGRTELFAFNAIDQPTSQTDDFGTPGSAADDQQLTYAYNAAGLERSQTLAKANGSGGWSNEQTVTLTYYTSGELKSLATVASNTTIEQETLAYVDAAGVYEDGNYASDVYQLHGPDSTAACYAATCTATWQYDARNRLVQESDGAGTTKAYTLDVYGNVVQESVNGTVARTASYSGLQLVSDTANGMTSKYIYDASGNLACVVTSAWTQLTCPSIAGAVDASLLSYNAYDSKNRTTTSRTYSNGSLSTSADYTYDALDRATAITQNASGVVSRHDFIYVGLSAALAEEQIFDGSGTLAEIKTYFDATGGRQLGMSDAAVGGAAAKYDYVYDARESVAVVIDDATGDVMQAYGYDAYGRTNSTLTKNAQGFSSSVNMYRFQGARFDLGSQTFDFGARHYTPSTGRFIQRDAYASSLDDLALANDPINANRYALEGANPINFVDSDGHRADPVGGLRPVAKSRAATPSAAGRWVAQAAAASSRTGGGGVTRVTGTTGTTGTTGATGTTGTTTVSTTSSSSASNGATDAAPNAGGANALATPGVDDYSVADNKIASEYGAVTKKRVFLFGFVNFGRMRAPSTYGFTVSFFTFLTRINADDWKVEYGATYNSLALTTGYLTLAFGYDFKPDIGACCYSFNTHYLIVGKQEAAGRVSATATERLHQGWKPLDVTFLITMSRGSEIPYPPFRGIICRLVPVAPTLTARGALPPWAC